MSKLRTKLFFGAAGLATAAALALTGTGVANASVNAGTPIGTTDGEAGYLVNQLGTEFVTTTGSFNLSATLPAIGVTTSLADPSGAVGGGLCNNSNGVAAEIGLVQSASGDFEVVYAYGRMKANGADPCVDNGILNDGLVLHPLLTDLTSANDGAGITYLVVHYRDSVFFAAEDNATGRSFSASISTLVRTKVGRHRYREITHYYPFNEPLAGVMADPSLLGGAATSDLVNFSDVSANHVFIGSGSGLSSQQAFPVLSSGDGIAPWLAGPSSAPGDGPNGETCAGATGPLTATNDGTFSICAATNVGA